MRPLFICFGELDSHHRIKIFVITRGSHKHWLEDVDLSFRGVLAFFKIKREERMVFFGTLDEFGPLVVVLVNETDVLADEQDFLGLCSPLLFSVIQGISKFALAIDDCEDGLFELLDVIFFFALRTIQLWDDLFKLADLCTQGIDIFCTSLNGLNGLSGCSDVIGRLLIGGFGRCLLPQSERKHFLTK